MQIPEIQKLFSQQSVNNHEHLVPLTGLFSFLSLVVSQFFRIYIAHFLCVVSLINGVFFFTILIIANNSCIPAVLQHLCITDSSPEAWSVLQNVSFTFESPFLYSLVVVNVTFLLVWCKVAYRIHSVASCSQSW